MDRVWYWLVDHWRAAAGIAAGIGAATMWTLNFTKLLRDRRHAQQHLQDWKTAQKLNLYADGKKIAFRSSSVALPEAELRRILLPQQAVRLHAALQLLRKEGRTRKAPVPGFWFFE
jgi:hypothetical protein